MYKLEPILQHVFFALVISLLMIKPSYGESSNTTEPANDVANSTPKPQLSRTALFSILSGEFATYRGQYELALDLFLPQAQFYQSAYLAERATRLALNQGHFDDMLIAAKIWQQAKPKAPLAYFFLSLAYVHNEDYSHAIATMEQVAQLGHNTDFTRLAHLISQQQKPQALQAYLQQLLKLSTVHPYSYDIHLATAILSLNATDNNKQVEQALFHTQKAADNAGNNETVYYYAARIYISLDKPELAMAMYQKAIKNHPDNSDLRLKYAQLATRYDLSLAAAQFEILRSQTPQDPLLILNLGLIYLDEGKAELAQPMFEQLLMQSEHPDLSHYYLGQIASIQGQDKSALTHFLAINDSPELARAKEQIASIYLKQQHYDEARVIIEAELKQPKNALHLERLNILKAQLLQKQGLTDKAYAHLSLQLSTSPDSIDIRYSRAMLAELQNNLLQMEVDLRHIIQLQPDSTLALNALGYTLANKTNRLDEAYRLIQQALELSPDDPAVLDSMGWVLYRMGQWQKSLEYLQQAMQQYPDAEVAAHLVEVLWMLGQKDDATIILKEALHQTPDHTELNETIKRLDIPL
ncbi:MAG: tetratricopeptide repeat protein [Pseudomonadales bacterium]|nr:tetratricopeptide repeat protein [Pseudomonadales bacterium]